MNRKKLSLKRAFQKSLAKWARAVEGVPGFDPYNTEDQPCGLCEWADNYCVGCPLDEMGMACEKQNSPWRNYLSEADRSSAAAAMYLALLMARDA